MMARKKTLWTLLFVSLAVGALILLVAGLPGLELRPGQRFSTVSKGEGAPPSSGKAASLDLTQGLTVLLLALLVAFGAAIIYLLSSPEARRKILPRLLPLLLLLAVLLVSRQRPQAVPQVRMRQTPVVATLETPEAPAPVVEFDATPPRWLLWGTGAGIALAVAMGVGGLVWLLWSRDSHAPVPYQELAEQAQTAIEGIESGADLKDTILRCYFEMARAVGRARGVDRWVTMTPHEFELRLLQAGLPQSPVQRLTRLFEEVRYGAKAAGAADEEEALACLASVVQACQEIERHNQQNLSQAARSRAED